MFRGLLLLTLAGLAASAAVEHVPDAGGPLKLHPLLKNVKKSLRLEPESDADISSSPARGMALRGAPRSGSVLANQFAFDPSVVQQRLDRFWTMSAHFAEELPPMRVYFEEVISDRFVLIKGFQLIRDELMLAFNSPQSTAPNSLNVSDVLECAADLSLPSVLSTCGYTVCGDRICQSNALRIYNTAVAGRFASFTEAGDPKPELFFATGGGTDSGPTLAHVTVAHSIDPAIRDQLYSGSRHSFVLVNIDICTHCGHTDMVPGESRSFAGKDYKDCGVVYGLAQESVFRDPRPTCGAIVGMLTKFNLKNGVHVRLRQDLGEDNYNFLTNNEILADDGSPINFLVAAAIISIQGMRNTLEALGPGGELDERGVGHMTAQVQLNNGDNNECLLYCARGTAFNGVIKTQGLGTDASKFSAFMVTNPDGKKHVQLMYDGLGPEEHPVQTRTYAVKTSGLFPDID